MDLMDLKGQSQCVLTLHKTKTVAHLRSVERIQHRDIIKYTHAKKRIDLFFVMLTDENRKRIKRSEEEKRKNKRKEEEVRVFFYVGYITEVSALFLIISEHNVSLFLACCFSIKSI